MFILNFIMKMIKVLGSETSPASIAAAMVLGLFLGLNPLFSIQALLCLLVVLFFKVNIGACLFSLAIWKVLYILAAGLFGSLGATVLDSEALAGLWASLYNSVLYYTGFYQSIVMGGILASAVLCIPVFVLALLFVKYYRHKIEPIIRNSKVVKAIKASKLYKLYVRLTSPLGGAE